MVQADAAVMEVEGVGVTHKVEGGGSQPAQEVVEGGTPVVKVDGVQPDEKVSTLGVGRSHAV